MGVGGLNASLTVFPAMPDSAYGYGDNCSARVTATFSLPASAAGQQALFVLNVITNKASERARAAAGRECGSAGMGQLALRPCPHPRVGLGGLAHGGSEACSAPHSGKPIHSCSSARKSFLPSAFLARPSAARQVAVPGYAVTSPTTQAEVAVSTTLQVRACLRACVRARMPWYGTPSGHVQAGRLGSRRASQLRPEHTAEKLRNGGRREVRVPRPCRRGESAELLFLTAARPRPAACPPPCTEHHLQQRQQQGAGERPEGGAQHCHHPGPAARPGACARVFVYRYVYDWVSIRLRAHTARTARSHRHCKGGAPLGLGSCVCVCVFKSYGARFICSDDRATQLPIMCCTSLTTCAPAPQVFIVTGPSGNTTGGGSGGGGILTPLSTPPPPPASRCDSPRLGSLCGAEAVGAIVGIIVGGLLLLGLLIGLAYSLISRVRN